MSEQSSLTHLIFGAIANTYDRDITPAFAQFAAAVPITAAPKLKGDEVALDVGTGTGILARLLAPQVANVIGIDLVPQMIAAAENQANPPNVVFQVADIHKTPFESASFDLIVASFGLNGSSPSRSLPELRRLLRYDGILAFHEWHIQHEIDRRVMEIFAAYMLPDEEISAELFALREYVRRLRPWDNVFQTAEDYQEELSAAGFRDVQVWEDAPTVCRLDPEAFMLYRLGWHTRQAELAAMDAYQRADCLDAIRRLLGEYLREDGLIHYAPTVFRVRAVG